MMSAQFYNGILGLNQSDQSDLLGVGTNLAIFPV
jgi:hypothetical protein